MNKDTINSQTICPENRAAWRKWLSQNHQDQNDVWLIYYKKSANISTLTWEEAVEEALCFGWIDSTRKSLDESRFTQYFSKRKKNSTWSKVNKDKIQLLITQGLMTQAGLDSINAAKENGSWTTLDDVENLIVPPDLEKALKANATAESFFHSLSKSVKKAMLRWITFAKRTETRQSRITELLVSLAQQQKPERFR